MQMVGALLCPHLFICSNLPIQRSRILRLFLAWVPTGFLFPNPDTERQGLSLFMLILDCSEQKIQFGLLFYKFNVKTLVKCVILSQHKSHFHSTKHKNEDYPDLIVSWVERRFDQFVQLYHSVNVMLPAVSFNLQAAWYMVTLHIIAHKTLTETHKRSSIHSSRRRGSGQTRFTVQVPKPLHFPRESSYFEHKLTGKGNYTPMFDRGWKM